MFRAPKTRGWCILGNCFWITLPWKMCSERYAPFLCIVHTKRQRFEVFCFGQMTHSPSAYISDLPFSLWHCLITSCLGSYSRTSTICSIWCVLRELLPAPPNPPAASVTSLRRPRQVPRWVVHALLLPFPSFHQWLVSFHHPGPCCNTTPASSLSQGSMKTCSRSKLLFGSRFKTLTVLQRVSTASRLQERAVMDSETEMDLSLTTTRIYSICKSKIL